MLESSQFPLGHVGPYAGYLLSPNCGGQNNGLNRAPDAMHRSLADLAGLAGSLELGGDLLEKLQPQLMIDRPG
jgi:hypothetical protein